MHKGGYDVKSTHNGCVIKKSVKFVYFCLKMIHNSKCIIV